MLNIFKHYEDNNSFRFGEFFTSLLELSKRGHSSFAFGKNVLSQGIFSYSFGNCTSDSILNSKGSVSFSGVGVITIIIEDGPHSTVKSNGSTPFIIRPIYASLSFNAS